MAYKGDKLADGTPLNQAVYRAFRNGGLSHNQALAITAEVGRENGFQAKYIFGRHIDPAGAKGGGTIQNTGFLSWNGNRGANLQRQLQQAGLMKNGAMARTQASLDAQARFAIAEMKGAYKGKLQHFWANPNADPDSFARELGKGYIVWAYGQNSIRGKSGGRVAFDWKAHDNRRRGYLTDLANAVGGGYQSPKGANTPAPSRFLTAEQIANVLPTLKLPQTAQRQAVGQQARQHAGQMLLAGIMGDYRLKDTGIGSGDHYDLRLARNANGTRGDINPYLNRFLVNGKGLNAYRQTGRYMEQRKGYRHEGVDFGLNGSFGGDVNARKLYVNPEFGVKGMRSFFDKHGGGWVTQVHFDDDIKVNILHQNRKGVNEVMNGWNGRQKSTPAPMTAQTARPQPAPSRFLSADQISKVLPNLAKATPMGAVAGMASTAGASVGRFLSSDQIAKVLPNLKLGG